MSVKRPNMLTVGVIVWLASELMFFAGLFAMYFTHRSVAGPEAWSEQTAVLNFPFALTIALILVSSSFTCQFGVFAAERFQAWRTGPLWNLRQWGMVEWYVLTFLLGAVFVAGQATEYAELIQHGLTVGASTYGSVFYILTGFHALHVIGGLIAFLYVLASTFASKRFGHLEAGRAVVTSYYWHFVDVVWIGLFILIYVIDHLFVHGW